eukprot:GFYU01000309.1.p1 GENE.GFYU01000309.1~~GFYU01000309.1.p1  ORF type:complete len:295 (-),score=60.88 GFYU01000309.1:197-1081(-)
MGKQVTSTFNQNLPITRFDPHISHGRLNIYTMPNNTAAAKKALKKADQLPRKAPKPEPVSDSSSEEGDADVKIARLMKNRESAQKSRRRKKIYIEDLETKVSLLSTENSKLEAHLKSTKAENKILHDEVAFLQSLISAHHGVTKARKPTVALNTPTVFKTSADDVPISTAPSADITEIERLERVLAGSDDVQMEAPMPLTKSFSQILEMGTKPVKKEPVDMLDQPVITLPTQYTGGMGFGPVKLEENERREMEVDQIVTNLWNEIPTPPSPHSNNDFVHNFFRQNSLEDLVVAS